MKTKLLYLILTLLFLLACSITPLPVTDAHTAELGYKRAGQISTIVTAPPPATGKAQRWDGMP